MRFKSKNRDPKIKIQIFQLNIDCLPGIKTRNFWVLMPGYNGNDTYSKYVHSPALKLGILSFGEWAWAQGNTVI